jgi:hypothetical protein
MLAMNLADEEVDVAEMVRNNSKVSLVAFGFRCGAQAIHQLSVISCANTNASAIDMRPCCACLFYILIDSVRPVTP